MSSITFILLIGFFLRLSLTFIGSRILDKSIALKYTDIDYNIITDAAQLILLGNLYN